MSTDHREELKNIRTFPSLVRYLRDEMGWPIEQESFEDVDDLFYDFTPDELGLDAGTAAKIESIKRLRPLTPGQPWGIYFVKFEPKRLPVVALRRILSRVALKRRSSANRSDMPSWQANDLLFVSNYGDQEGRCITFAHFAQQDEKGDLPTLKVLGWDSSDTALHLDDVADKLRSKLRWPDDAKDLANWRDSWRSAFTLEHREVITTSRTLAVRLADLARAIRDRIRTVLSIEAENGPVTRLMKAFQEALVHDLDEGGFADMYAQTIAYGLLSARITNPKATTADGFGAQLPITNPFLKELMETFLHITGRKGKVSRGTGIDFDELGVSEVVELLDDANMEAVVRDFGDKNPQEDPVIHFYELFLKEYDKKQKVSRGVFYTPRPVVSYIVRSVHELLQTEFGLADGLADTATWGEMAKRHKGVRIPEGASPDQAFVQILDPATGTGTFLVEGIDLIHSTLVAKWKAQGHGEKRIEVLWNEYVPKHLLTRLHGYELLMAPYAIAHLKIGLKLHETGYRFESDERARIYLTNALEPAHDFSGKFEFMIPALAHEAQAVNEIKRNQRFTVLVGNPPYSNFGQLNRVPFILGLLEAYKRGLEEKKLNLDDDFIKFFRLCHWHVDRTGCGVLGLITNNTYFEGVTRRQMRASILESFNACSLMNLHGDTRQGEHMPSSLKDENVFDIQQGVGISLLRRTVDGAISAKVEGGDLYGHREAKYSALLETSYETTKWISFMPRPPLLFFRPTDDSLTAEYHCFPSICEALLEKNTGIETKRDALTIQFSRTEMAAAIRDLLEKSDDVLRRDYALGDDGRDWRVSWARADLQSVGGEAAPVTALQYRPFDIRWTVFTGRTKGFIAYPRAETMSHLLGGHNCGLIVTRLNRQASTGYFFCTRFICDRHVLDTAKDSTSLFPLYIESDLARLLESGSDRQAMRSNVPEAFRKRLSRLLGLAWRDCGNGDMGSEVGPEDVLSYAYAVFHSPIYRKRYAEYLKIDFPRLPLPGSPNLFRAMVRLGRELVALHLMESPIHNNLIVSYAGPKDPRVDRIGWSNNTVWLDAAPKDKGLRATLGTMGFRGVTESVWNFHIGGYQVCEKWLKDRKGRQLSEDEITHYQKIVAVLSETIRIMGEIDKVIGEHGGWPGAFLAKIGEEPALSLDQQAPLPKAAENRADYKKKCRRFGPKS